MQKWVLYFIFLIGLSSCGGTSSYMDPQPNPTDTIDPVVLAQFEEDYKLTFTELAALPDDQYYLFVLNHDPYSYVVAMDKNHQYKFIKKLSGQWTAIKATNDYFIIGTQNAFDPTSFNPSSASFFKYDYDFNLLATFDNSSHDSALTQYVIDIHDLDFDSQGAPIEVVYINEPKSMCPVGAPNVNPNAFCVSGGIRYQGVVYNLSTLSPYSDTILQHAGLSAPSTTNHNIWDLINSPYGQIVSAIDYLHVNGLTRKGNLVYISTRMNSGIYIFDLNTKTFIETADGFNLYNSSLSVTGSGFSNQHSPIINAQGNLMIFDNNVPGTGASKIKEYQVDLVGKQLVELNSVEVPENWTGYITGNIHEVNNSDYVISSGYTINSSADHIFAARIINQQEVLNIKIQQNNSGVFGYPRQVVYRVLSFPKHYLQ